MAAMTGMLMLGKISFAVRRIANTPINRIKIARTMNVYGRCSAILTIHIPISARYLRYARARLVRIAFILPRFQRFLVGARRHLRRRARLARCGRERIAHNHLRFGEDLAQMIIAAEALRVGLVDVLGPGGTRRAPAVLRDDLQAAD